MKMQKRVVEKFSFYDHTGMEKRLEEMAEKGWLLTKITNTFWVYKRIDPVKLHFAVTYYPNASDFDPEPLEEEMIYRDYGEYAGWKFVTSSAQMQIFCNAEENPIPMETDPFTSVNVIHRTVKKAFLPTHFILLGISILQAMLFISTLLGDPIRLLSSATQLTTGFLWFLIFLLSMVELIGYYRWHHKALIAADQGVFLDTHGHGLFQNLVLIAALAGLLNIVINLFSMGDKLQLSIYLLLIGSIVALIIIVNSVKNLLKRMKVNRKLNFTLTLAVDIFLAFFMMGMLAFSILKTVQVGGVDSEDSEGHILYQVEAPLMIEDLLDVSSGKYIKENRQSESIILGQRSLRQWVHGHVNIDDSLPEMYYTITLVKADAMYDFCKKTLLKKRSDEKFDDGSVFINHYEQIDERPWLCKEAYQLYFSESILYKYLLCYEDRLIEIEFDWEPTEEQMRIVAEKLAQVR